MNTARYFKSLGISPTKDENVIKKAYRKKVLKYHPDRNSSEEAKEKFIEVTEAYDQILFALEQAKNRGSSSRATHTRPRTRTSRPTARPTSPHHREAEERLRNARRRYEYMRKQQAEESERYYQKITSGFRWNIFKYTVIACTIMSFLIVIDTLILPTQYSQAYISHHNTKLKYNGIRGIVSTPVILNNEKKVWIPAEFFKVYRFEKEPIFLQKTMLFKDIKTGSVWINNQQVDFYPEYSQTTSFPTIPILLLIPLITYATKKRSYQFMLFYNISTYLFPIILIVLLISNDRWLHLFTFGLY